MNIVIIGSGFSGIGMAIQLKRAGIDDFVILERAAAIGGVWRDNTYPGCACDVESQLYSFSFAPNPKWSRFYAPQQEIWEYLQDCVARFDLQKHIRLNHDLISAHWDTPKQVWRLKTSQGDKAARILISGAGVFGEPLIPEIPGLAQFRGKVFHSGAWDHQHDLKGKHVAVIGTGASAIQFIPAIQPQVGKLTIFQRTPAWIVPRGDRALKRWEQRIFNLFPSLLVWRRWWIYRRRELFGQAFRRPYWMKLAQRFALKHMHQTIRDPHMRRQLTPDYTIGCKRVLLADDFYPTLMKNNVKLVTDRIAHVSTDAIATTSGERYPVDTIILGTGFKVTNFYIAHGIYGKSGRALFDVWRGSPRAFLGTTIPDFPNCFLLMGPNTGLGHSSVLLMMEAQIQYVVEMVKRLRERPTLAVEPRAEREQQYTAEVDQLSERTVWKAGRCQSWYLDHTGRNSTLWPVGVTAFRNRLKAFDVADYHWTSAVEASP